MRYEITEASRCEAEVTEDPESVTDLSPGEETRPAVQHTADYGVVMSELCWWPSCFYIKTPFFIKLYSFSFFPFSALNYLFRWSRTPVFPSCFGAKQNQ